MFDSMKDIQTESTLCLRLSELPQMSRVATLIDGLDERLSKMEQRPVDYAM